MKRADPRAPFPRPAPLPPRLTLRAGLILALSLLSAPSGHATSAEGRPLSASEFDSYVTGKTLTYDQLGESFGTEEYLPDRKVRWQKGPEDCLYGRWYPQGSMICFAYDETPAVSCWTFWRDDKGLRALGAGSPPWAMLRESARTEPLNCGPDFLGM